MLPKLISLLILVLSVSKSVAFNSAQCPLDNEGFWAVGMVTGPSIYDLTTPHDLTPSGESCLRNPIISCLDVTDVPAAFVADPFMYVEDNLATNPWYAFFEVKNANHSANLFRRHGQIGAAVSTNQGKSWKYLQIVLVADFHLSYPFVFKYQNEIYMMPQGKILTLWKATSFPLRWTFHSTVHDRTLNDATIIEYQGRWWMFALHEMGFNKDNWFLHILYSDSPLGPWSDTPHNCACNPRNKTQIYCLGNKDILTPHRRGRLGVRPGGHMIIENGKLYRMVQNSLHHYGDSMDLYEITSLTTTGLLEDQLITQFQENFRSKRNIESWNEVRYHHIDLHSLHFPQQGSTTWVGLFDGDYNQGSRKVLPRNLPRCQDFL